MSLENGRESELRVNIGCGRDVVPGWVNLDKSPSVALAKVPWLRWLLGKLHVLGPEQTAGMPPGARHADAARHIPLADDSASYIYTSHMIEHMARWQGEAFLAECRRILVADGLIRILTPDLRTLAQEYLDGTVKDRSMTPADSFVREFGAYYDIPENRVRRFIRRMMSGAIHQWLYDYDSLEYLLREMGFTDIRQCSYRDGRMPDLDVIEHRPRSLFVEARYQPGH